MSKKTEKLEPPILTKEQEALFSYEGVLTTWLRKSSRKTRGEVLTVIDACIQDTEQRKAVKDLIHEKFNTNEDFGNNISSMNFNRISEALNIGVQQTDMEVGPNGNTIPHISYHMFGKFLPPILGSDDELKPITKK